uniref:Uncharacterized protein n=1 Tax=Ditylenchus dipsaci TaxID=166011 RepID=A0A915DLU5_9BILA
MGGQPTKFSRFYKKLLAKRKAKKIGVFGAAYKLQTGRQDIIDSPSHVVSSYTNELNRMKRQMNDMVANLRQNIDQLENEHKKRLQKCIQKCKSANDRPVLYSKTESLKKWRVKWRNADSGML